MAMAFVQDDSGTAAAASHGEAFTSEVTVGSIVCGGARWNSNTATLDSVAQSAGTATIGTVTLLHNPTTDGSGNSMRGALWYAVVTGTGSLTITYTFSTTVNIQVCQAEASGVSTGAPLKGSAMQAQNNPGTGTDAVVSGTTNAGVDGDFIWGFITESAGSVTVTAGTGFTAGDTTGNTASEHRVTAADQATATHSSATSDTLCGVMIFNQFVAAAPSTNRLTLLGAG